MEKRRSFQENKDDSTLWAIAFIRSVFDSKVGRRFLIKTFPPYFQKLAVDGHTEEIC